ncbi:MAG TPA: hypothetical protein VHJ78_12485 [Actinomycetota bacterium]|nr:hypothetical protein [Actinomycetota bacterium]
MMPAPQRRLAYLVAGVFLLPGAALYLFPERAADDFSWPITPFVAMTMGSWFLGGAYVAWRAARLGAWWIAYPGLLFLGLFGLLELVVVLLHRDEATFTGFLPTVYFLAILAALLAGTAWLSAWGKDRGSETPAGDPAPVWMRILVAGFLLFAAYIGIRLLLGTSRGGEVWPGRLSLVTARSFGAFYTALALTVIPLLWSRSFRPILALLPPAAVGSVLITVPAFVYFEQFDFEVQPGGRVYIGTYLFVLVAASVILLRNRLREEAPAGSRNA